MPLFLKLAALSICLAACTTDQCLPEPASDTTPPLLRVVVRHTPPGGGSEVTREITADDSVSAAVAVDRLQPVRVDFVASDPEGLRRLRPSVAVQRTVGIGVDRQYAPTDPVAASCPLPELRSEYEAHTSGEPRVLIVSALAENWTGLRTTVEPLSIQMK